MKRNFTLLLMLGVFTLGVSAQNLVLNPGFEDWDDVNTPTSWTHVESVDREAVEFHSGTYSAKHTGGTKDLGQTIPVTEGENYKLSLWYKVASGDGSDARIWSVWQTTGVSDYTFNGDELRGPNNSYLPNGSGEWMQYETVVTAPAGITDLYLEVRTYSGAVVYYDDFSLEVYVDVDPPVWEATYPMASNVEDVQFDLAAKLDETSTVYYVVLDDGAIAPTVEEVKAGTGSTGAAAVVAGSFTAGSSETLETVTGLVVETAYDVYVVAEDDEATPNVQSAVELVEITTVVMPDFNVEGNFDLSLAPFTEVSVVGDQVWYQDSYSGNGYAYINGYSGGAQDNDDYLISPAINLDGSTSNTFSFVTAKNYSGPALQVLISNDFSGTYDATEVGNATWTDLTAEFSYSGGSYAWVESGSFDLSAYSGTVYIAFRYLSNPTDGAATWEVDDFEVTGFLLPDESAPVASFAPADGAVDVAISSDIVLTFDEPVLNVGGTEITDPSGLVELRETDAAGTEVPFTATINAEKDAITINPDADLLNSQLYYVALKANVVEDALGNVADAVQSSTFTTIGELTPVLEITYPVGGEILYIGEDVHIDWNAENVGDLTLWVSSDNGVSFDPFIENLDPALGTIDFTIPLDADASTETVIRITESTNLTFEVGEPMDDSESFTVIPMLSVSDIQGTTEANGNSSYEDTLCMTTGIVTYADGANEYYISDGEGAYSGVVVIDNVNTPVAGDSIVIAGTVEENYGLTRINSLILFEVIESGKVVPAPVDVATGLAGEELEGVIVKLSSAVVVTARNSYGETEVDDGTGVVLTDDVYFDATLNVGGTYDITGPLSYAFSKWRVYPRAAEDVVEIPSSEAAVTSDVYVVDDVLETITGVPALEDLATFKANIAPVYGAVVEVYEADGSTVATDLQSDYKVVVTSQDGLVTTTYTITKDPLSDDATVTSQVYTVDDVAGTISGILFNSSVTSFESWLVPATGGTFVTYESDGTTVATDMATGYKLIVTAEDGTTTKTYELTLDEAMPADLIFSEYIEGSSNNKAIEVFNPNDDPIRLDYYQVAQLSNGGEAWEYFHQFPAGTVLGAHETWVMITDQTDGALFAAANADEVLSYPSVVHHNGDDARGLVIVTGMDTTLVDIIGEIGPDPGTGWDVAGVTNATAEHTLIRKGFIMSGNTDWAASAGTTTEDSEWIVKDQNFFDSLGIHTLIAPIPSDDATLSGLAYNGTAVTGFSPAQLTYFVQLPAGTVDIPVVTATTSDENATVVITDATDLAGDAAARTTTVEVTAEDGEMVKTYTIEFTVEVGVESAMFNRVKVYPVPAMNTLYLEHASDIRTLTMFDITGTAVMQMNSTGEGQISIDISSLDSGVYMIRMANDDASAVVRFVKY